MLVFFTSFLKPLKKGGMMSRKLLFTVLIILLLSPVWARNFSDNVKSFSLSNGMRFLVFERPGIPTFAGLIMTKVGSVDERNGETGLAHFFEHLAFKGTPVMGTRDYVKECHRRPTGRRIS
jgi:hypothetical protein